MNKHGVTADRQEFFDDADAALGLERRDHKGRVIATLPIVTPGYDRRLVDVSADRMVEIIAADERAADEAASQNIEQLMSEVPGGRTGSHSSSSGRRRREKPRFLASTLSIQPTDETIHRGRVVAGRISINAYDALSVARNPSIGVMLEHIGRALARGAKWEEIEQMLANAAAA